MSQKNPYPNRSAGVLKGASVAHCDEQADDYLLEEARRAGTEAGKDIGAFLGMSPTGKAFAVPGVFLFELRDGKIVRERRIYDFTSLLIQTGLMKAKPAN